MPSSKEPHTLDGQSHIGMIETMSRIPRTALSTRHCPSIRRSRASSFPAMHRIESETAAANARDCSVLVDGLLTWELRLGL